MRRLLYAIIAFLFALPALAGPRERFMVVFGAQGNPDRARASHTWASFVTVQDGRLLSEDTISWLPAPGYFGPGYEMPPLAVVPGHNYSLDETLAMTRIRQVMYWGPYRISEELYQKALERVRFLSIPGGTSYKMFELRDALRRPALYNQTGGVINCIIAVSDLGGWLDTGNDWGLAASRDVLGFLARSPVFVYDYPWGVREDVARLLRLQARLAR